MLDLIRRQAEITVAGMEAFAAWSSSGDEGDADRVRALEHSADTARLRLVRALSEALATPVDQEDLYLLSERLDITLNTAKNAVREASVLGVQPDRHARAMSELVLQSLRHLREAIGALGTRGAEAGSHADAAVKAARGIEKVYREAIASLPDDASVRQAIALRELYRAYVEIGDVAADVATRTWYALLKSR